MKDWSNGVMEYWKIGVMEKWNDRRHGEKHQKALG